MTGSCKWFDDKKGFGFITPEDGSADVFVHHTAIKMEGFKTLAEGQKVEYTAEGTPKGIRATNVVPLR